MIIYLENQEQIVIHDAFDAYIVMLKVLDRDDKPDLSKEHLWVIALNLRNLILNIELISIGDSTSAPVCPKDVLSVPSQKRASSIVMIHNHPSGNLKPSESDLNSTDLMIQAGRILGIGVEDHLIISEVKNVGYYSFENSGTMEKLRKSEQYVPAYEMVYKFKQELRKGKIEAKKKGLQQGEKKGIKLGKEIGRQLGEKKGRQEEKLEIARAMVVKGYPVDDIISLTGLSESDIQELS